MENETKTEYNKNKNLHEALLSPPHDGHKFSITIEKYESDDDIDSLIVEVRKVDSKVVLIMFRFAERLNNVQNKKNSSFTIPINIVDSLPPYIITIYSNNNIDLENYLFNIEWISIRADLK